MGGPTTERWHEPSVLDVAAETTRIGLNGVGPWRSRNVVLTIAIVAVFALLLPKVGSETWNLGVLGAPILITITLAYRAGRRQQILGRDTSRVVTAVVVTFIGAISLVALFVAISLAFGPTEDNAPFTRFLEALDASGTTPIFLALFCVGLGLAAVVGYVHGKAARLAAEASLEEEARTERAARAAAGQK